MEGQKAVLYTEHQRGWTLSSTSSLEHVRKRVTHDCRQMHCGRMIDHRPWKWVKGSSKDRRGGFQTSDWIVAVLQRQSGETGLGIET